ncbi:hypothetical protein Ahy_B01g055461 isoform A [Arachis hypogaea]|uniref:Uncharacterized protein n=1 Tax=Arachis hypogaea TaxID=3818 RepID=A0A445AWG1_ARAHY|nr:hypothetical protein Ahy_B01g055461 isoform A [Arachis hypogaea]
MRSVLQRVTGGNSPVSSIRSCSDFETRICDFSHTYGDLGTEYLVRPAGPGEEEDASSDFDPDQNGRHDEDEDVEKDNVPSKRKRSDKDDDEDDDDGDGGEDDERPSKR